MKANELTIGDWVYRNSYSKKPMRVTLIDEGGCYLNFDGNEGDPFDGGFGENGIQPIPLTDEILELNGWQAVPEECRAEYKYFVHTIVPRVITHHKLSLDGCMFCSFLIRYIHEFQHLLRFCGYDDLADNFEIEEI